MSSGLIRSNKLVSESVLTCKFELSSSSSEASQMLRQKEKPLDLWFEVASLVTVCLALKIAVKVFRSRKTRLVQHRIFMDIFRSSSFLLKS